MPWVGRAGIMKRWVPEESWAKSVRWVTEQHPRRVFRENTPIGSPSHLGGIEMTGEGL